VKASHESFAECELLDVRGEGANISCSRSTVRQGRKYTELLCNRQGFQCDRVRHAWQTPRHRFQDLEKGGEACTSHAHGFIPFALPKEQHKSSAADTPTFSVSLAKPGIIFLPAQRPICSRGWRVGLNAFIICFVVG